MFLINIYLFIYSWKWLELCFLQTWSDLIQWLYHNFPKIPYIDWSLSKSLCTQPQLTNTLLWNMTVQIYLPYYPLKHGWPKIILFSRDPFLSFTFWCFITIESNLSFLLLYSLTFSILILGFTFNLYYMLCHFSKVSLTQTRPKFHSYFRSLYIKMIYHIIPWTKWIETQKIN